MAKKKRKKQDHHFDSHKYWSDVLTWAKSVKSQKHIDEATEKLRRIKEANC